MIKLRSAHENIIAALEANLPGATQVGDNQAPSNPVEPYTIFYSGIAGRPQLNRGLSGGISHIDETVQVSVVGRNRSSVDVIADHVRDIMVDVGVSFDSADVKVTDRQYVTENQNFDGGAGAPRHGDMHRLDLRFSMWIGRPS